MKRFDKKSKTIGMTPLFTSESSAQSPASPKSKVKPTKDPINVLQEKIESMHSAEKMRVVKNVVHNLYGRHNTLEYRPEFNFQENWENSFR